MSILDMLYTMIIGPLQLLFDVIFSMVVAIIKSPGLTIVVLSLVVNLLVLPLYKRADEVQEEEREQSARLKPGLDHIRKVFKGDERVMIQQAFYRQNHYKPWYALKGSLSLLLEIPFFVAAYNFLSGLQTLQGVPFGPITDLGAPDGLLKIGGVAINVLPVLMTGINIVSGAVYTKGMPLRSKIQLYGMALIFLVLLYDSPAGLVFYWTLNNVFSLVKNLANRLKNPKVVLHVFFALVGLAIAVVFVGIRPLNGIRKQLVAVFAAVALQVPWVRAVLKNRKKGKAAGDTAGDNVGVASGVSGSAAGSVSPSREGKGIFWGAAVFLAILTGVLIPSAVIKASVGEFVEFNDPRNPLRYVLVSALQAFGAFVLWGNVFWRLTAKEKRGKVSLIFLIAALGGAVDFMFFGKGYGNLSSTLRYDLPIEIMTSDLLLNLGVLILLAAVLVFLWKKNPRVLSAVTAAAVIAVSVMAGMNVAAANSSYKGIETSAIRDNKEKPGFPLDKSGKNVVVIMMDRAIDSFVPFLFEEKPVLKEQFAGFTWYPNTLSYGGHTNVGAPCVFGGYDYLPDRMQERDDVLLVDKHNESLKIMPVNFLKEDFFVTVCDPPYANYAWIPQLEIYDEWPEIRRYNSARAFMEYGDDIVRREDHIRERNLWCYALTRSAPVVLQNELYGNGKYNETDVDFHFGSSGLDGLWSRFLDAYLALKNLNYMTHFSDEGTNTFLMLTNNLTHEVISIQGPDYNPENTSPDMGYNAAHSVKTSWDGRTMELTNEYQWQHYSCNMTAFLILGEWLDYLRENGVYDNTRIIIVADHGRDLSLFGMQPFGISQWKDLMMYNPLLMVKDFGETGPIKTDNSFMTNADTPLLAFEGLVENPVNPFLGNKPITDEGKHTPTHHLMETDWDTELNNGYTFADPMYITLEGDNVLDPSKYSLDQ